MKDSKKFKVLKELLINDFLIGVCFWSVIIFIIIPFFKLPQSLETVLSIFLSTVCLICLPYSLYKISTALNLTKKGAEITATNIFIEQGCFGKKIRFEYDFDGRTYKKQKFYPSIFFPEKDLKLLVDRVNPSKYIILEFKKKSVISVARERKP
jgi:hypothetical protein